MTISEDFVVDPDLKECPFCGSNGTGIIRDGCLGRWYARCYDCQSASGFKNSKLEAVTAWNKRSILVTFPHEKVPDVHIENPAEGEFQISYTIQLATPGWEDTK